MIGKSPKTQPNTHVSPPNQPPKGNHFSVEQEPYFIPELTQKIGEHYSISKKNGFVIIGIDTQHITYCVCGVRCIIELPKELEAGADLYQPLPNDGGFIAIDATDNTLELYLNPIAQSMGYISIRYKGK